MFEIFSASDDDDRRFHLKQVLHKLLHGWKIENEDLVDSEALSMMISAIHRSGDCQLREVVARVSVGLQAKVLSVIRWISRSQKYGNVLEKWNTKLSQFHQKLHSNRS